MSVLFESVTNGGEVTAGATTSAFSHTVASVVNGALLVHVRGRAATSNAVLATSVTFNGVSLALVPGASLYDAVETIGVQTWILVNPPAVTANVVVTWAAGVSRASAEALTFSAVDQVAPLANVTSGGVVSTAPSFSIHSMRQGAMVVSNMYNNAVSGTLNAGPALRVYQTYGGGADHGGSATTAATSAGVVTHTWTNDAAESNGAVWCMVVLRPVSTATVLHQSFFTGTDGDAADTLTPQIGVALADDGVPFIVGANRVYGAAGVFNYNRTNQTLPADVDTSIVARQLTSGATTEFEIQTRRIRANGRRFSLRFYTSLNELRLVDSGITETTLATYAWTPSVGVDYALRLRVAGNALTAFLDGVQIMAATSSAYPDAGDSAFEAQGVAAGTTGWHFDTFTVETVASDEVPTGTTLGLVIGSETAFVGEGFVGSIEAAGGGGTAYTQTVDGALGFAALIALSTSRSLSASASFAGVLLNIVGRSLAGALGFAGALSSLVQRTVDGAASFVGDLIAAIQRFATVAGDATFSGAVSSQTALAQVLDGAASFAGEIVRVAGANLAAVASFAGDLAKQTARALAAGATFAGDLTKLTGRVADGAVSFAGDLAKTALRILAAALTTAGDLARAIASTLAGAVSFAGALAQQLVLLRVVDGVASFAGALVRVASKSLDATVDTAGALARTAALSAVLAGVVVTQGALSTLSQFFRTVQGVLTATGVLDALRFVLYTLALSSDLSFTKQLERFKRRMRFRSIFPGADPHRRYPPR